MERFDRRIEGLEPSRDCLLGDALFSATIKQTWANNNYLLSGYSPIRQLAMRSCVA